MPTPALILAAPSSGCGKTTLTLGILRALTRRGTAIRGAKSGPDYIDPAFHAAACGRPCYNLDAWAMPEAEILSLAAGNTPLLIEGAMGLFDGAPPQGKGATADLARMLDVPVVLIVDARSMSHSVAALVAGFASHDPRVRIAGVILNRVGSDRHAAMLCTALAPLGVPVLGTVPRTKALDRPSRHLGLVQAGEMPDLHRFLDHAADIVESHVDLHGVMELMTPFDASSLFNDHKTRNIVQHRVAIAQDAAFSFAYPHQIAVRKHVGQTILPFSPLSDDPVPDADEIFLPGGYPELHAARLSNNRTFLESLRDAAQTTDIYGECGGYMVLGKGLTDADGIRHEMAGLLPLETSFARRKLHLGYRTLIRCEGDHTPLKAHEFHYATTLEADGAPLFNAYDAEDTPLGPIGLREGRVSGSFAHVI